MYDDSATYHCAFCGEPNETDVDLSGGRRQTYIEDCQVCCRPNRLVLRFDDENRASLDAMAED